MKKADAIPRLIRELRNHLGLSQEKFAARLGVTSPTINRRENARAKPSPLALAPIRAIAESLGQEGSRLLQRYLPEEEM
ncbi:MAG: helix-turn-helix transcriptional regulator [Candidatus Eisenbacteria bacterium]|nr:helix-turn-helix transcriptional regulator [Candidatus Eisenbacteria bacterium]